MGTDIIIYVCVTDAFEMEKVPMTGSLSFILYKNGHMTNNCIRGIQSKKNLMFFVFSFWR